MERVTVAVSLPTLLLSCTGGRSEVEVEATTLEGAIAELLARYPLLRVHLFDERGELREHVNLFYNDEDVRWLADRAVPLRPGDTVTILQAVSGG